ncbi:MAG: FHA domain-containing protein [Anaerolineae bacterium]|jgi:ribosomal protein L40E
MSRFLIQDRSGFRQVPIGRLMTIGRSSDNDLVLHAVFASRRHAWVWSQGDDVILEDLGSTYGTLVNGQTVRAPVFLNYGDVIHIGEARLTFVAQRDPATSKTPPSLRVQDVQQPMAAEVPCARCGAPNDPQARFCANCGYSLDLRQDVARGQGGRAAVEGARLAQPITPLEPVVARPFPRDSQTYPASAERSGSDRRLWALILILAMLAVILVTIVAALLVIVLG